MISLLYSRVLFLRLLAVAFFSLSAVGVLYAGNTTIQDHRAKQERPISLGTSGGPYFTMQDSSFWVGTLGALVQDAMGDQYILSNNHVLVGANDQRVTQPGPEWTLASKDDIVAELSAYVEILFDGSNNLVDAAIALVEPGDVKSTGDILGIGQLSANTVEAFPGQKVQKSGRRTGHTKSEINHIDVTSTVNYGDGKYARFVNQISVINTDRQFVDSGDSGSLLVEDAAENPRTIGLIFAGSNTRALANPIGYVLDAFGVTMVGGGSEPQPAPTATPTPTPEPQPEPTATPTATPAPQPDPTATPTATPEPQPDPTATPTPAPESKFVHIESITYSTHGGRFGTQHLRVTVRAITSDNVPVSDAEVAITVANQLNQSNSGKGKTGNDGTWTFSWNNAPNSSYNSVAKDVISVGLVWDGNTPNNSFLKSDATSSTMAAQSTSSAMDAQSTSSVMAAQSTSSAKAAQGAANQSKAALGNARNVNRQHSPWIMRFPGVVGHGVGLRDNGQPYIAIYLENENVGSGIPSNLDNMPVEFFVTGQFMAY